jgi:hypothetical protein
MILFSGHFPWEGLASKIKESGRFLKKAAQKLF